MSDSLSAAQDIAFNEWMTTTAEQHQRDGLDEEALKVGFKAGFTKGAKDAQLKRCGTCGKAYEHEDEDQQCGPGCAEYDETVRLLGGPLSREERDTVLKARVESLRRIAGIHSSIPAAEPPV